MNHFFHASINIYNHIYIKCTLSGLRELLATEAPLKMIRNAFISPQTFLPFSRCLSFYLGFLIMYQNGLIKTIRTKEITLASGNRGDKKCSPGGS